MSEILNIEIKAKSENSDYIHETLKSLNADYKGCDHQIDTYFNCDQGRLKLRSGNIENSLIFYNRDNQPGPKQSDVSLSKLPASSGIKEVLTKSHGVKVEVDKQRHIYFIDNVKFHVDEVSELGHFVEIEAIDNSASIGREKLLDQCQNYMKKLKINESDLVDCSYSDLLLEKHKIQ